MSAFQLIAASFRRKNKICHSVGVFFPELIERNFTMSDGLRLVLRQLEQVSQCPSLPNSFLKNSLMSTSVWVVGFLGSMSLRDKLALVSLIYIDTTFLVERCRAT